MKITKGENARLRWLLKSVSKNDERPRLECARVSRFQTVTTDGFRFHAARTPLGLLDETAVKLPKRILKKDTEIEVSPQDYTSPDFSVLVPKADPVFEIHVTARFLRDALEGMDDTVTLRFYGKHDGIEVLGRAPTDDTQVYALIMPRSEAGSTWRPYQES